MKKIRIEPAPLGKVVIVLALLAITVSIGIYLVGRNPTAVDGFVTLVAAVVISLLVPNF
jgi:hypothetical protein